MQENERAVGLLAGVCAEVDEVTEPRARWEAVVRGVFAGNIFDLGCAATTDMYHQASAGRGRVAVHWREGGGG